MLVFLAFAAFMQSELLSVSDAPPETKSLPPACACPSPAEIPLAILKGAVVDAELTLGADGLSVNTRQATIINLNQSVGDIPAGRTRIWHSNDLNACGVQFNYGRTYRIAVRRSEDGALETDKCLMDGPTRP